MSLRLGILTISDMGARGEREDTSGAAIRELLSDIDAAVEQYEIIPDEASQISELGLPSGSVPLPSNQRHRTRRDYLPGSSQ